MKKQIYDHGESNLNKQNNSDTNSNAKKEKLPRK